MNGVWQICLFARINAYFGSKYTFMVGIAATTVMYASFPMLTLVADARGSIDVWVYAAIGVQLVASMLTSLSYGTHPLAPAARSWLTRYPQAAYSSSSPPRRQTRRRSGARTDSARWPSAGCARSGPGSRTRSTRSRSGGAAGRSTSSSRRSPPSRSRARASSRAARGRAARPRPAGLRATRPRPAGLRVRGCRGRRTWGFAKSPCHKGGWGRGPRM
jgi:hypothetical protein